MKQPLPRRGPAGGANPRPGEDPGSQGRARTRAAGLLAGFLASVALIANRIDAGEPLGTPATAGASPGFLHVQIDNDLVTLEARDATIKDLLQEIARQSHLVVVAHGALDERLTLTLHRQPLPEAIERILRRRSYALESVRPPAGVGGSGGARPSRLWIFSGDRSGHATAGVQAQWAVGADAAVAPLTLGMTDEDPDVRLDAFSTLADLDDELAVDALAGAMASPDPSVREEVVGLLGEIGGAQAISVLERALVDRDTAVRDAAIDAFANIGGDESARALAAALNDEDASLRADAVDALGEIGGQTAIGLLQQALTDEQAHIREAAAEYLSELSDPD